MTDGIASSLDNIGPLRFTGQFSPRILPVVSKGFEARIGACAILGFRTCRNVSEPVFYCGGRQVQERQEGRKEGRLGGRKEGRLGGQEKKGEKGREGGSEEERRERSKDGGKEALFLSPSLDKAEQEKPGRIYSGIM